jgi:hypothetical protein
MQLDHFISHLHRAIGSRDGRDVILLFAGEAARMFSYTIDFLIHHLRKTRGTKSDVLRTILRKRLYIPMLRTAAFTRALLSMLDEWQVMNRLWGVLDMWMAAKQIIARSQAKGSEGGRESIDIMVSALQTSCLTSFHVCEALSFFSTRKMIALSANLEDKLTYLAIRSWTASTAVEIGRLSLEYVRRPQETNKECTAKWRKDMLQNLAWACVASHWSTRGGLIPEALVSPLAVFATWSLVTDIWKQTR